VEQPLLSRTQVASQCHADWICPRVQRGESLNITASSNRVPTRLMLRSSLLLCSFFRNRLRLFEHLQQLAALFK
jgi:hypothetical protein